MSQERIGFVEKIFKNEGTSGKGPWYAYSFKIASPEGEVDPIYYQLGFNKEIGFKEGDYISFEADPKDDKSMTLVEGSGKILKNPPARKESEQTSKGKGNRGAGGGAKVTKSDFFGDIGGYNTEDDIKRMTYSVARGHAIELVKVLIENDGLPSSVAKSKAGQASRFEEINAFVDKKTVEFFYDGGLRKLETVADAGVVNVDADSDLPDKKAEEAPAESSEDTPPAEDAPPAEDESNAGTF